MLYARLGQFIGHLSDRPSSILLAIVASIIIFGALDFVADLALVSLGASHTHHAAVQAGIVGLGAGAITALVLFGNRERRSRVAEELRRVAELNHTLRNSLEVIAHAHYLSGLGEDHKRMMDRAVSDIDTKLKELFPVLGARG